MDYMYFIMISELHHLHHKFVPDITCLTATATAIERKMDDSNINVINGNNEQWREMFYSGER